MHDTLLLVANGHAVLGCDELCPIDLFAGQKRSANGLGIGPAFGEIKPLTQIVCVKDRNALASLLSRKSLPLEASLVFLTLATSISFLIRASLWPRHHRSSRALCARRVP